MAPAEPAPVALSMASLAERPFTAAIAPGATGALTQLAVYFHSVLPSVIYSNQ